MASYVASRLASSVAAGRTATSLAAAVGSCGIGNAGDKGVGHTRHRFGDVRARRTYASWWDGIKSRIGMGRSEEEEITLKKYSEYLRSVDAAGHARAQGMGGGGAANRRRKSHGAQHRLVLGVEIENRTHARVLQEIVSLTGREDLASDADPNTVLNATELQAVATASNCFADDVKAAIRNYVFIKRAQDAMEQLGKEDKPPPRSKAEIERLVGMAEEEAAPKRNKKEERRMRKIARIAKVRSELGLGGSMRVTS